MMDTNISLDVESDSEKSNPDEAEHVGAGNSELSSSTEIDNNTGYFVQKLFTIDWDSRDEIVDLVNDNIFKLLCILAWEDVCYTNEANATVEFWNLLSARFDSIYENIGLSLYFSENLFARLPKSTFHQSTKAFIAEKRNQQMTTKFRKCKAVANMEGVEVQELSYFGYTIHEVCKSMRETVKYHVNPLWEELASQQAQNGNSDGHCLPELLKKCWLLEAERKARQNAAKQLERNKGKEGSQSFEELLAIKFRTVLQKKKRDWVPDYWLSFLLCGLPAGDQGKRALFAGKRAGEDNDLKGDGMSSWDAVVRVRTREKRTLTHVDCDALLAGHGHGQAFIEGKKHKASDGARSTSSLSSILGSTFAVAGFGSGSINSDPNCSSQFAGAAGASGPGSVIGFHSHDPSHAYSSMVTHVGSRDLAASTSCAASLFPTVVESEATKRHNLMQVLEKRKELIREEMALLDEGSAEHSVCRVDLLKCIRAQRKVSDEELKAAVEETGDMAIEV